MLGRSSRRRPRRAFWGAIEKDRETTNLKHRQGKRRAGAGTASRVVTRRYARPCPPECGTMIRLSQFFQDDALMAASTGSSDRFLLWIDAVGGYWVTMSDTVVLGQPTADVDVPILGDISKRHARICRDGEGYLIEALRPVHVNGQPVEGRTILSDRAIIRLGDRVELCFRRPHALSATARLEFVTGHRTQPSSDAVLLMAETCVLGPSGHSHVVCHNWVHEVVMFRRGEEIQCRTAGNFEIDGKTTRRRGSITRSSHVQGDRFSFSLEAI